jgi:hypothetical protein
LEHNVDGCKVTVKTQLVTRVALFDGGGAEVQPGVEPQCFIEGVAAQLFKAATTSGALLSIQATVQHLNFHILNDFSI